VDLTPEQAWACFHGPTKTHVAPPDWDSRRREHAMRAVLEAKFSGNVELRDKLLGTGRAYLVENSPLGHDDFWADNGDGSGANVMGRLLMQLRETLGGGGAGVVPCPDVLPSFTAPSAWSRSVSRPATLPTRALCTTSATRTWTGS
jgi:hypothetical protein